MEREAKALQEALQVVKLQLGQLRRCLVSLEDRDVRTCGRARPGGVGARTPTALAMEGGADIKELHRMAIS